MDLPGNANPSKVWAPTCWELRKMYFNNYKTDWNRCIQWQGTSRTNATTNYVIQDSIHTFLFKLTRRSNVRVNHCQTLEFMEEDAVHLCSMLRKEGFYDMNNENCCAVCATEKLERNMLQQMQREIEVTRMARNYFAQIENSKQYRLCPKHRPFNPQDNIPKCQPGCKHNHHPKLYQISPTSQTEDGPVSSPALDSYIPIPAGQNPDEFKNVFYKWVSYLNGMDSCEYKRMPYTKNIQMNDDVDREKGRIVRKRIM